MPTTWKQFVAESAAGAWTATTPGVSTIFGQFQPGLRVLTAEDDALIFEPGSENLMGAAYRDISGMTLEGTLTQSAEPNGVLSVEASAVPSGYVGMAHTHTLASDVARLCFSVALKNLPDGTVRLRISHSGATYEASFRVTSGTLELATLQENTYGAVIVSGEWRRPYVMADVTIASGTDVDVTLEVEPDTVPALPATLFGYDYFQLEPDVFFPTSAIMGGQSRDEEVLRSNLGEGLVQLEFTVRNRGAHQVRKEIDGPLRIKASEVYEDYLPGGAYVLESAAASMVSGSTIESDFGTMEGGEPPAYRRDPGRRWTWEEAAVRLRDFMRDYPAFRKLNMHQNKYTWRQLYSAFEMALADWNSTVPPSSDTLETLDPTAQRILLYGAAVHVMEVEVIDQAHEQVDYQDQGLSISEQNKAPLFMQVKAQLEARYEKMKTQYKSGQNLKSFDHGVHHDTYEDHIHHSPWLGAPWGYGKGGY